MSLGNGEQLAYDWLILPSGSVIRPDLVSGMGDGSLWHKKVHEF